MYWLIKKLLFDKKYQLIKNLQNFFAKQKLERYLLENSDVHKGSLMQRLLGE